jgi:hypothetical protein
VEKTKAVQTHAFAPHRVVLLLLLHFIPEDKNRSTKHTSE